MDPNQDPWEHDTSQRKLPKINEKRSDKKYEPTHDTIETHEKSSLLSIISLILSIILPPIGLILAIIILKKNKDEFKGKTITKTALIISIVIFVVSIITIILQLTILKNYSIVFT